MTANATDQTPVSTLKPKAPMMSDFAMVAVAILVVLGALLLIIGFKGALGAKTIDVGTVVFDCTLVLAGFGALFTTVLVLVLAPRNSTRLAQPPPGRGGTGQSSW